MKKVEAIQIIGTQRSGSNLLRLILNQINEVSAPHPPHVLKTFIPLVVYYDLENEKQFELLVNDICEFVNKNPVAWSNVVFDADKILSKVTQKNIYEVFRAVYQIKAEEDGATIWCCKSTFNAYYASDLEKNGIKPVYIYLYRDGRDVATSFRKALVGPKHVFHIAKAWKRDQQRAMEVREMVGLDRFISVKYENLITNPELTLSGLCDKLGLPYHDDIMSFYNSEESVRTAKAGKMWENLTKPIMSDHYGLYLNELSTEDKNLFEQIAGDVLARLGYNNISNQQLDGKRRFNSDQIREFNALNREMKLAVRTNSPISELEARSKQEEVILRIKSRYNIS